MATTHRPPGHPEPTDVLVVFGISGDPATFERVAAAVGDARAPVFYLEVPPFLLMRVVAATPYEVLLRAAMVGNSTRFTRQDGAEEAWRVLQPLLDRPPPVHPYTKGSWGPEEANRLVAGHGRWHGPWVSP